MPKKAPIVIVSGRLLYNRLKGRRGLIDLDTSTEDLRIYLSGKMTSLSSRLDTWGANVDVLFPLSLPPIIKTASFHKLNKYHLQGVVERLVFKSPSFFQQLTLLFQSKN